MPTYRIAQEECRGMVHTNVYYLSEDPASTVSGIVERLVAILFKLSKKHEILCIDSFLLLESYKK